MSVNDATLSVVVPVHNDAAHLESLIQECLAAIPRYFADYEIIIVDDHSSDTTREVANQLAVRHDPIMVLHNVRRRGYGNALASGIDTARGDYILCLDAGIPVAVSEIARLLPFIERYDVVMGYRLSGSGGYARFVEAMLRRVVNWLFGIDLRDVGCRLGIFRADVLRSMKFTSRGVLLPVELYVRARQHEVALIQVGVATHPHASSQSQNTYARLSCDALWSLVLLRARVGGATASSRAVQGSFWRQRATFGAGLAAVAGGIWFLLRRRSP